MVSLNRNTGRAMRNRTLTAKSIRKELRRVGPMANPSAAASRAIGAQAMHREQSAMSPSRCFPSRTSPNFSCRRYKGPTVKRGNSAILIFLSADGRVLAGAIFSSSWGAMSTRCERLLAADCERQRLPYHGAYGDSGDWRFLRQGDHLVSTCVYDL